MGVECSFRLVVEIEAHGAGQPDENSINKPYSLIRMSIVVVGPELNILVMHIYIYIYM